MGVKVTRKLNEANSNNSKVIIENFSGPIKQAYLDSSSNEAYIFDADLDRDEVLEALQEKFSENGYDSEQAMSLAEKVLENQIDLFEWN